MAFSSEVKEELCRLPMKRHCCAVAEAYGILLFCHTFNSSSAKIITVSDALKERLPQLFQKAFGVEFDEIQGLDGGAETELERSAAGEAETDARARSGAEAEAGAVSGAETGADEGGKGAAKARFLLRDPRKLETIFSAFDLERQNSVALHINLALLEEEHCRSAFLRGAFLAGGSMTDPMKGYHLEMSTSHHSVGREAFALLQEAGLSPKITSRKGSQLIYFKQSNQIEDFLVTVGASSSAMSVMTARMHRDIRSSVNRQVNCDSANADKIVEAAQEQLAAIQYLQETGMLAELPSKLRDTAQLRLDNPDLPLSKLAELCTPPVSKPAVNHRLRKLVELARQSQGATAAAQHLDQKIAERQSGGPDAQQAGE